MMVMMILQMMLQVLAGVEKQVLSHFADFFKTTTAPELMTPVALDDEIDHNDDDDLHHYIMMLLMIIIIQITISFKYPVCGLRSRF